MKIIKVFVLLLLSLLLSSSSCDKKVPKLEDENEENTYELLFKKILKALFYGMGVKEKQIDEMFNQTQVDAEEGK